MRRTRRLSSALALVASVLLVVGCGGPVASGGATGAVAESDGLVGEAPVESAEGEEAQEVSAPAAPVPPETTQEAPANVPPDEPAEVVIPAIDVRSPLIRLGLNPDRTLEVPENFSLAGWYTKAPKPGEVGPAVIAGHVDSVRGPAVFHRLHQLKRGHFVHVRRGDGTVHTFVVERVERHPKNEFPTAAVYGDTERPELRVITCGGDWDRSRRSYRDNIIVYAALVQNA